MSEDTKYKVTSFDGSTYLLRISSIEGYQEKKQEYDSIKEVR